MEIDLDSDEDHEVSSSENIQEPELPASYSYEDLKRYLKDAFGFDDFREGQFETISNILEGKSVLFIS
jgi:superfamily II DNA helicase RecQ